jgi:hypothetical protein
MGIRIPIIVKSRIWIRIRIKVMWIRIPAYNVIFINIFLLFVAKKKIKFGSGTGIFLILKRPGTKKAKLVRQRKKERKQSFLEEWTLSGGLEAPY